MKKLLFLSSLVLLPLTAAVGDEQRCADLLKECFAYSAPDRDACFKTASAHTFCGGTKLAELASKRAHFSLMIPSNEDQGPAFLGPQLVNPQCISNFDNSWSAAMVKGPLTDETLASLTASLDSCARVPASELVRP